MSEADRRRDTPTVDRCIRNRFSIWPVEGGGYGIGFIYHGATGYSDAEYAEHEHQAASFPAGTR
jgi:hypothetical protein